MKLASIFTDHMVIQSDRPIKIFGEGKGNVLVEFLNEIYTINSNDNKWCITLPARSYGGPYEMKITLNGETTVLKDIYVGEVWLAAGQSNMEMPLFRTVHGFDEAKHSYNEKIRLFTVPRRTEKDTPLFGWHFQVEDGEDTPWQICSEESVLSFSAIGYYVAKELQGKLGVAVGIISCNWGGRTIEAYVSNKDFDKYDCFKEAKEKYEQEISEMNCATYEKEYREYVKLQGERARQTEDSIEFVRKRGVRASVSFPKGWEEPPCPKGPYNVAVPGCLYDSMYSRIIPYGVKGVLWYQGESNNSEKYAEKYGAFMECMRRDFENENMPFYATELSWFHRGKPYEEDRFVTEDSWAFTREQQQIAVDTYKNSYLVTGMELGDFYDIHPIHKSELSHRMAIKVLKHTYGFNIDADQPIYRNAKFENGKVYLKLANAKNLYSDCLSLVKIYIADESKKLKKADIEIDGDTLILCNAEVKNPILARYAFDDFHNGCYLYNEAGLPLAPFRTDND